MNKILLIGGALLLGYFLLSNKQSIGGGVGGVGGVGSGGVGTVMQPLIKYPETQPSITETSYPVTYNLPAFPEPAPLVMPVIDITPPETFFAPEPLPSAPAPAPVQKVTTPTFLVTPEVIKTVEKREPTKKETLVSGGYAISPLWGSMVEKMGGIK